MEVFISKLDSKITKEQLQQSLTPLLRKIPIEVFEIRKQTYRTFAYLTVADRTKAEKLLAATSHDPKFFCSPSGKQASFVVSKFPPKPLAIKTLQKEEKDLRISQARQRIVKQRILLGCEKRGTIQLHSVECGRWEEARNAVSFIPYYRSHGKSSISSEGGSLIVKIHHDYTEQYRVVIEPYSIQSLSSSAIGDKRALTVTLVLTPKIFQECYDVSHVSSRGSTMTQNRECNLPKFPSTGHCLVYRFTATSEILHFEKRVLGWLPYHVPLAKTTDLPTFPAVENFTDQVSNLNAALAQRDCSFPLRFQIHALWANALLSPNEVQAMFPAMHDLQARLGEDVLIAAIARILQQLPFTDATTKPLDCGSSGATAAMMQQTCYPLPSSAEVKPKRDEASIHRVTVTPTGIYLYGPEVVASNRVLRQYRKHHDCFLRVLFVDEDEERIRFDREISNHQVLQGKFLSILSKGLDIAGEHFDFLGFSHSSLRAQACWFMRPFLVRNKQLFARDLIKQLGDFSKIQCPAKCAARIGQAFTEFTRAVEVNDKIVSTNEDTTFGDHTFTDGCGTISKPVWRSLAPQKSPRYQPTSYQIRYKGAKGMLTLDTRLKGHQIRLRESMIKFTGSPSNEIEICGSNSQPLSFKLNRQIIKILEDRNISASVFEKLQDDAMQKLQLSTCSMNSAANFVSLHLKHGSSGLSTLLRHLETIGIDVSEDNFFREIFGALLQVEVRDIKYRSRIPVPDAVTLYGISDESQWLQEGQVFVSFASANEAKSHLHLKGRIAVTRSPALHPGDIQIVQAVTPPPDSCLWSLRNCIVFSQRGQRDLPSMLSGGDLDGDLYNIIYDDSLIPRNPYDPAMYPPARAIDIGRPVTADDMARVFINFMQNDQLGRIATLHQVLADQHGTSSPQCLLLAELHSAAVDFSKSGVPVDIKKIPKSLPYRPDFMAPSASTKIEKGIKREKLPSVQKGRQYRYYESDRVLGRLYRAIDEDSFFQNLEEDNLSIFSKGPNDTVLGDILSWIQNEINPTVSDTYRDLAEETRDYYESTMLDIMSQYRIHHNDAITEKEVFIGTILGRSGAGSKWQREQSENMKRRFNRELSEIKYWIESQTADDEDGLLNLSAACLYRAVWFQSNVDVNLNSFGWFSAGICVPEVMKRRT